MTEDPTYRPPKFILGFFRWFCRPEMVEDIEGDLREKFQRDYSTQQKRTATWDLIWQVLLLFRPGIIRPIKVYPFKNNIDMFRHNLLIAWRNSIKKKSTFFINLIGLSSGLACVLLIFIWVQDELKIDQFHTNGDRIYQILENVNQDHGLITRVTTAGPTAEAIVEEMPEVDMAVTTTWISDYTLSQDAHDINAKGIYASKDFFQLFTYPLLQGISTEVLAEKTSIVISERLALSLFGTTENIIGKTLKWQHERDYQISGVFKDVPAHSSKQFDFALTFEGFRDHNAWVTNWFNTAPRTYVLLEKNADLALFNEKINTLVFDKTNGGANHRKPFAALYKDRYLHGHYENGFQSGGRIEYVNLFSIIALFILFIACINFMNLSTAQASKRIREIGIKKTLGATRHSLMGQFFSESLLLTFLALCTAIIVVLLLLPNFNLITGKELHIPLNPSMILSALGLVAFVAILAGSYPAMYLSSFRPVEVLKGKLNSVMGSSWARKGLVIFQFTLSVVLISAVWVVYKQMEYVMTKNLGYSRDNIVLLSRQGDLGHHQEAFLAALKKIPQIEDASAIGHSLAGHNGGTYGVSWPGKDPEDRTEFERVPVDFGLIELLDIEMKEGRAFSKDFTADTSRIIFNEAAIAYMELQDPIGKTISLWDTEVEIVGVAKNFHFDSFHEQVKPLFMWIYPDRTDRIAIKLKAGKEREALDKLRTIHAEFNPGFPFEYAFLDEGYQALYESEQRVATLSKYFAGLAIIISCLGLFGLSIFTSERRKKEIGIRKVLGSSEFGIVYMLSVNFTKMVAVAIFIALPVSYFLAQRWLAGFAFPINLSWTYFLGSGCLALAIAWFTLSFQTFRAAYLNPIESLRNE